jgi:hypothetical protein
LITYGSVPREILNGTGKGNLDLRTALAGVKK